MSSNFYKIKLYGIGGQGVVTATNLLCNAACLHDNKYGRTQPSYGHERRGAPVVSHLYIDDKPIQISSFIYKPDIVVLLDPHIKDKGMDITEGIHPDTILVINSNNGTTIYDEFFKDIYVLNATKLSLEYFKTDIPNIPMLGAFAKTGIVQLSSIEQTIQGYFKQEQNKANIKILNEAYGKTEKYNYLLGPVAIKIATQPTGKWKSSSPSLEQSKCNFCSSCEQFCPASAIEIDKHKKNITIDYDYCKGCGICANVCKRECIEMLENE